jgi:hypothetical protein
VGLNEDLVKQNALNHLQDALNSLATVAVDNNADPMVRLEVARFIAEIAMPMLGEMGG